MDQTENVVFLLDVDNTLLDNDRFTIDLQSHLTRAFGSECQKRYWVIFENLRQELGYADYLGALQRYRVLNPHDSHFLGASHYILEYPFSRLLYPNSLDVINHLQTFGATVILTDGDVVFQPRKIERSGLLKAVHGQSLIYIHKEQELDDVARRFPADHYVLVDDKLRILTSVKKVWGSRVTTVFPKQGHYALDPTIIEANPPADLSIDRIGDLLQYPRATFLGASR